MYNFIKLPGISGEYYINPENITKIRRSVGEELTYVEFTDGSKISTGVPAMEVIKTIETNSIKRL